MNRQKKLRVAVIGAGNFAEVCHIPYIISHPQAEVAAVFSRNIDTARKLAAKFSIPIASDNLESICGSPAIDAVTIASANAAHAEQAVMAIGHGKHVFCEKPLAMNDEEAKYMLKIAAQSKMVHQVAFTFRYNYGIRELRRRVTAGEIGDPYFSRIQYDRWDGLTSGSKASWRDIKNVAGAGLLFDFGSHLFDIQSHVLSPIQSVIGYTHTVSRKLPHRDTGEMTNVETDDIVNAWTQNHQGLRGQFFISRVTPPFAELGYLEVIGNKGALKAALSRGGVDFLKRSNPDSPEWSDIQLPQAAYDGKPHALELMMHAFVDSCLKGDINHEVDASFYDGCAAQFAMSALLRSESSNCWEKIQPV